MQAKTHVYTLLLVVYLIVFVFIPKLKDFMHNEAGTRADGFNNPGLGIRVQSYSIAIASISALEPSNEVIPRSLW